MIGDQDRLRAEYANREQRLTGSDVYSVFNPANLFMFQQYQRTVLRLLRQKDYFPLKDKTILEVGCGVGVVLQEFLMFGAVPEYLHGCDLLSKRTLLARQVLPDQLPVVNADGQFLPYPAHKFDLVLQHTVFSSILDDQIKANVAREMLRVTRYGGVILWYDFWLNPTNPQTRGIRPSEIRRLFPGCSFEFHKITLAPPITRRLVKLSWILCLLLEKLKFLNTHYLVVICPPKKN